jgi:hypothetical protein
MSEEGSDDGLYQAAAKLYRQYGDDAEIIATMRAAEFAAQFDVEALAHWDAIIAILQKFTDTDGGFDAGATH